MYQLYINDQKVGKRQHLVDIQAWKRTLEKIFPGYSITMKMK